MEVKALPIPMSCEPQPKLYPLVLPFLEMSLSCRFIPDASSQGPGLGEMHGGMQKKESLLPPQAKFQTSWVCKSVLEILQEQAPSRDFLQLPRSRQAGNTKPTASCITSKLPVLGLAGIWTAEAQMGANPMERGNQPFGKLSEVSIHGQRAGFI